MNELLINCVLVDEIDCDPIEPNANELIELIANCRRELVPHGHRALARQCAKALEALADGE